MFRFVQRLLAAKDGATAIEYALIASLIAMVIISAVLGLGERMQELFSDVANGVN
jgi:pilus assembly protein Flp/PilA